jgi:hypothetical protein
MALGQSGGDVKLATYPHLVIAIRIRGTIPQLADVPACAVLSTANWDNLTLSTRNKRAECTVALLFTWSKSTVSLNVAVEGPAESLLTGQVPASNICFEVAYPHCTFRGFRSLCRQLSGWATYFHVTYSSFFTNHSVTTLYILANKTYLNQ